MTDRTSGTRKDALAVAATFVAPLRAARTRRDLAKCLGAATRALGFDHYALVHHGDLRSPRPGLVRLDSYPAQWAERFVAGNLSAIDPVHQASLTRVTAFAWTAVPSILRLTPQQEHILAASAKAGLRAGITVPLHLPGEPSGSCSLAAHRRRRFDQDSLAAVQLIGTLAFDSARRIVSGAGETERPERLTARQRECLVLAAQGKSDWEIGRILGLSEETVTKYLNAARARYAVARRIQLAVSALHAGELSFAEVVRFP